MKRISAILLLLLISSTAVFIFAQDNKPEKKEKAATEEVLLLQMNVIDNRLHLKNAPVGKRLEIITILGNKIKEIEIKVPDGEYELNLSKAIYIFKLDGTVRKFVIK